MHPRIHTPLNLHTLEFVICAPLNLHALGFMCPWVGTGTERALHVCMPIVGAAFAPGLSWPRLAAWAWGPACSGATGQPATAGLFRATGASRQPACSGAGQQAVGLFRQPGGSSTVPVQQWPEHGNFCPPHR